MIMSSAIGSLESMKRGENRAADELLTAVYDELRRMATRQMSRETAGNTLQPTALVHEAYFRLVGDLSDQAGWPSSFFGAVAEAMGRILIENATRRKTLKLSGDVSRQELIKAHEAFHQI